MNTPKIRIVQKNNFRDEEISKSNLLINSKTSQNRSNWFRAAWYLTVCLLVRIPHCQSACPRLPACLVLSNNERRLRDRIAPRKTDDNVATQQRYTTVTSHKHKQQHGTADNGEHFKSTQRSQVSWWTRVCERSRWRCHKEEHSKTFITNHLRHTYIPPRLALTNSWRRLLASRGGIRN